MAFIKFNRSTTCQTERNGQFWREKQTEGRRAEMPPKSKELKENAAEQKELDASKIQKQPTDPFPFRPSEVLTQLMAATRTYLHVEAGNTEEKIKSYDIPNDDGTYTTIIEKASLEPERSL